MAGGRANWENMLDNVTKRISEITSQSAKDKAKMASENMGTGMARKAAETIKSYEEKRRKEMEDAGI